MALGWRGQYYRYKDLFLNIVALYKQKRDLRVFLDVILSLTTIIIFIVFALKPTALTIISLYNEINDKKVTLSTLNQKINDLQTANSNYTQDQSVVSDVDAAIFTNPEPDTVSKQILGLAAKDSVNLLGISIGETILFGKNNLPKSTSLLSPLPGSALSMPVSVSARGNYPNLIQFVKDIENLRIPFKIDSLAINSSTGETGNVIVETITARVPYLGSK